MCLIAYLRLAHKLAKQPLQGHRKIRVETEEIRIRNFLGKDCQSMVCSHGLSPAGEERRLNQERRSPMRPLRWLDCLLESVGHRSTWGSVCTWKSPKAKTAAATGLSEEEELVLGRHQPPSWLWSTDEVQVWAMWGRGAAKEEGPRRPGGGTTGSKGIEGGRERAQVAGEGPKECRKVPHKNISTEYSPKAVAMMPHPFPSFTPSLGPVPGMEERGEVDHACFYTAGVSVWSRPNKEGDTLIWNSVWSFDYDTGGDILITNMRLKVPRGLFIFKKWLEI